MYNIWNNYNQVHLKGDKKSANKLLAGFIDLYKKQDRQTQKRFVDEVCTQTLDKARITDYDQFCGSDSDPIRIQFPLFKEVILPELLERYKNNDAQAIRWLGQLENLLSRVLNMNRQIREQICRELGTDCYNIGDRFFFEKSYEIDKNQRTLDFLLETLFSGLTDTYYYCKTSAGVLLPERLNSDVTNLRKYWEQWEKKNEDERISRLLEYESIAYHWEIYCKNSEQYDTFWNYLLLNSVTELLTSDNIWESTL